ncbi:MAG: YceI family protein, partial [Flavobacteriales bacterium]|nr:YceI family protein [Flavobacteriales bacterium]
IATIVFDRTKYDIKYNSGSYFDDLGNYLILDDVKLNVFLLSEK